MRVRVAFRGVVQGVGFRPSVFRLATSLNLTGWVVNTPDGALAEVEGPRGAAERFLLEVKGALPPRASVYSMEATWLDPAGYADFEIRESIQLGSRIALVPPDIATCHECLAEMRDPNDRRYRYPFVNCTNCGPRFSIIARLPYDRPHTTMAGFAMCAACRREYEDPLDRRFHAQPNACPACGPHIALWSSDGATLAERDAALIGAVEALRGGHIVAIKGLGGFHLLALADADDVIRRLRSRKRREEKPLALMCPSLDCARALCLMEPLEERSLTGPEHPIVLMRKRPSPDRAISELIAPGNPYLGIMLPYTPLHHLIMAELDGPVVATSGNASDEPICTDEHEALERLAGIADCFLVHNRPIHRHVDDSIVRIVAGQEQVLRRARGFAPLPVALPHEGPVTLATGAHLKNAVALATGSQVYISQHIGDLDTRPAREAHVRVAEDLLTLYEAAPALIACDAHPDYASSIEARRRSDRAASAEHGQPLPQLVRVQHHYAHVLSCMLENGLEPPALGVSWDGTGLGDDGTIWGGEFLQITQTGYARVGYLRTFRLPGGDAAMREPRRSAVGVLYEIAGERALRMVQTDDPSWDDTSAPVLARMLESGVNSPRTSSAGRLFDAVACLIGLRSVSRFEGQAAMELEWAIRNDVPPASYRLAVRDEGLAAILDWEPMIAAIGDDHSAGVPLPAIARGFHEALIRGIVDMAIRVGLDRVVLSGGCWQNRYLTEGAIAALTEAGFRAYIHQRVPPNDGGIALGQVAAAHASLVGSDGRE